MKPIVAIGDIHADFQKLEEVIFLLSEEVNLKEVPIVFLGDVVDGGSDAKQCLDYLFRASKKHFNWEFLLGNHEDLMLNALGARKTICSPYVPAGDYDLWYYQGGKETLHSYLRESDMTTYERAIAQPLDFLDKDHIEFIKSWQLWHETKRFIFVHAGLKPKTDLRHSSPAELLWIRDEFIRSDFSWGKRVVFGHTCVGTSPLVLPNKIGLDTMHHGYGQLSAAILDDDTGDVVKFVHSQVTQRTH